jgi:hypothetical protein
VGLAPCDRNLEPFYGKAKTFVQFASSVLMSSGDPRFGGLVKAALQLKSPASHLLAFGAIQISPKKRGALPRHPPALPNQPTRIAVPSLEQLSAPAQNSIGTDAKANFWELSDSWTDGEWSS